MKKQTVPITFVKSLLQNLFISGFLKYSSRDNDMYTSLSNNDAVNHNQASAVPTSTSPNR